LGQHYYDQTPSDWGTPLHLLDLIQSLKSLYHLIIQTHQNENLTCVGVAFKKLFVNMITTSQVKPEEDIEPFDTDPWAQQLDLQWEKRFEQHDPPTENKVIQIDMGDQTHPKLNSISESLSLTEKQDLISLIKEYIDVFT